jgi:hypothetical protein
LKTKPLALFLECKRFIFPGIVLCLMAGGRHRSFLVASHDSGVIHLVSDFLVRSAFLSDAETQDDGSYDRGSNYGEHKKLLS